jgi:hypothetical protein
VEYVDRDNGEPMQSESDRGLIGRIAKSQAKFPDDVTMIESKRGRRILDGNGESISFSDS